MCGGILSESSEAEKNLSTRRSFVGVSLAEHNGKGMKTGSVSTLKISEPRTMLSTTRKA